MIIKIAKIISCSSDHPLYPSSNLLEHPPKSSWRCAKPNELIATVIFQLAEASCITGLEIGNYHSCFIIVEASTFEKPDTWIPIVNHQFLSHDEVANSKFRDQVQIFTKRELNPETINIKFDRVKVTCMQSANPREIFGLNFIILKTEVVVDLGLDIFGRFKLKEQNDEGMEEFKEKYLKLFVNRANYKDKLKEKIIESGVSKFVNKQETPNYRDTPILDRKESNTKLDESKSGIVQSNTKVHNDEKGSSVIKKNENSPVVRTLFGDIVPSPKRKKKLDKCKINEDFNQNSESLYDMPQCSTSRDDKVNKKDDCSLCRLKTDELCNTCNLVIKPQVLVDIKQQSVKINKYTKPFGKLFDGISFSLSGYVNPQRDEIRRKALKMGAKYIVDPNLTNNKCTHLICRFKKTPKSEYLKGHCKIVDHKFIEDCFNKRKRIPWRRYALDSDEQNQPESEEEIMESSSPSSTSNVYEQDTDSEMIE
ncbi:PREDICTED: DNA repair protein XRCC1 [Ceratosolen solmsi marchali]|uniref:DNA repair protein XRCC1 n=1 Tax=Ceratosolen solmsi marchali TaxID=326594 RepID=A0AAJ7E2L0_9HYME|nr:PREDICTED: DNA repair protein XRCC1 [Ceratosolen solmsi marchali]